MDPIFYPFKCEPLLKEKLWGGNELSNFLKKPTSGKKIGESWEVASLPEGTTSIANGIHKGKSLNELISAFAKAFLGTSVLDQFGPKMPLLIKFIDASDKLSVQLHPDDTLAREAQLGNGKTEMWYIIKAQENAHIIAGFNEEMNARKLNEILKNDTLEDFLNYIPVKSGDAFYISAGLIHAIGEGILLAEIQQPSDVTYRVHDYNRVQEDGSYRELHLDQAKKAIKFDQSNDLKLSYDTNFEGSQILKHSPFFKTDLVTLDNKSHVINRNDSLTIIIVVNGSGGLMSSNVLYPLNTGDTYVLPAECAISTINGNGLNFLEVYF